MANFDTLKTAITEVVKTNGNNEITGALLQDTLLAMVDSLGTGYQFKGGAVPSTEPGTPDQKVAYFAGPGTYPNFGAVTIPDGYVGIFYGSGSTWNVATAKTSPFTAVTVASDIIQLMDGTTPVYPRTRAEAVFFGNDQTDTLDEKVEEIEGNISQLGQMSNVENFVKLELGRIDSSGNNITSTNRIRTVGFISAPFKILVNTGYQILNAYRYTIANDGTIEYNGLISVLDTSYENYDESYIYRIVFRKPNDSTLVDADINEIIAQFTGSVKTEINDLKTKVDAQDFTKQVNLLMTDVDNKLKLEIGTINGTTGAESSSTKRIKTSFSLSAPFKVTVNSGYQIYGAYRYTLNADGTITYVGLTQLAETSYEATDERYIYRLVFRKPNDETVTDSDLTSLLSSVEGRVAKLYNDLSTRVAALNYDNQVNLLMADVDNKLQLEIGTINGTTGVNGTAANRARTKFYISAPFKLVVNSGYQIYYAYRYTLSSDGTITYVGVVTLQATEYENTDENYIYRFVLRKTDDANISSTELNNILGAINCRVAQLNNSLGARVSETEKFPSNFVAFQKGYVVNYDWQQGTINGTTGEDASSATRIKTGYLLGSGEIILCKVANGYTYRVYHYDSSKDFIEYVDEQTVNKQFTLTDGDYYRFVLFITNGGNISPADFGENLFSIDRLENVGNNYIYAFIAPSYSNESGQFLKDKTVAFIGDSITQGSAATNSANAYHGIFASLSGCNVRNLGVNGTCIANNAKNGTGSSRFVTRATSENLSDVAMVVVFGGTNDLSYDSKAIGDLFVEETITPSGNIGDKQLVAPTDTDTFAGALHNLITTIQQNVTPGTPIVFMTPIHRNNNVAYNPNYTQCNANGDYMIDFVNAIKSICAFYAIPVLDMYSNSQLNPLSPAWSYIFADGLHPNDAGHKIIGELLYKFVKENVFNF